MINTCMAMVPFLKTVAHGLLVCIPFSIFIAVTFGTWPRLWLHSLPADIIQMAPPKTNDEKKITKFVLLPIYLLILPGLSVGSVIYLFYEGGVLFSFAAILAHLYGIWLIVHFWDLLMIDGIAMLLINPDHPPIRGTEGAKGWRNYTFHIKSFCKAVVMSAIFVVPASAILYLIQNVL
jgi:hypothetical protein